MNDNRDLTSQSCKGVTQGFFCRLYLPADNTLITKEATLLLLVNTLILLTSFRTSSHAGVSVFEIGLLAAEVRGTSVVSGQFGKNKKLQLVTFKESLIETQLLREELTST